MNESLRDFCQRIRDVVNACADGEIIEGAIANAKAMLGLDPDKDGE